MRDGRLAQVGTPKQVYDAPADLDVARFVGGAVVLPAVVEGGHATSVLGTLDVPVGATQGAVEVLVRPEQIVLTPAGHNSTPVAAPGAVPLAPGDGPTATVREVRLLRPRLCRAPAAGRHRGAGDLTDGRRGRAGHGRGGRPERPRAGQRLRTRGRLTTPASLGFARGPRTLSRPCRDRGGGGALRPRRAGPRRLLGGGGHLRGHGDLRAVRLRHPVDGATLWAAPAALWPGVGSAWHSSLDERHTSPVWARSASGSPPVTVYQVNLCRVLSHQLPDDADLDGPGARCSPRATPRRTPAWSACPRPGWTWSAPRPSCSCAAAATASSRARSRAPRDAERRCCPRTTPRTS